MKTLVAAQPHWQAQQALNDLSLWMSEGCDREKWMEVAMKSAADEKPRLDEWRRKFTAATK